MKNRKVVVFGLIFFVLFSNASLQAGSIWSQRDKNMRELYVDDVANKIGDILTITVSEISKTENKSNRQLSKTVVRDQNFDGQVSIEHIIPEIPTFRFGVGTEYKNTLNSFANNKDERAFTDSITVMVIDVMPNGNLVVFGTRERNISDDIQLIEISGIVRPSDIEFDNTINSAKVANFRIVSKSKGVGAQYNRPNWLGRIFDVIWPF